MISDTISGLKVGEISDLSLFIRLSAVSLRCEASVDAMGLSLKMLGGFILRDGGGAELSLPTRKIRALLSYLAVSADKPQPRERLMALLWGDRGERQARQSLNQALMSIRRLGEHEGVQLIDSDGERVTLRSDAISSDVEQMRSLVADDPATAANLYDGPFLEGLSIPDPAFEEWLLATRSEMHALACDALETAAISAEDTDTAIDCTKRLVVLDPLREEGQRRLMQLLHQSGDRAGALRQYQACMEILKRELQVEPDAATRRLYEEIRRNADTATEEISPNSNGKPSPATCRPSQRRPDVLAAATVQRRPWLIAGAAAAIVLFVAAAVWFALWIDKTEPVSNETATLPLPDKPSIAVLPFTNKSDDPSQEYFADGMTDDLITDLSKISGLFVIARNSTFTYKGKATDSRQIAAELGVRYVMEGSVRRVGNQIRINTQLVDATTGGYVWTERYDGTIDDVFALQDRIAHQITEALALKLTPSEVLSVAGRGTSVVAAQDAFLKGWNKYLQSTPDDLVEAVKHFKEAIALDPDYGRAHAAIALTYWQASQRFWEIHLGMSWTWARMLMLRHLETALKEPSAIALTLASSVYVVQRRYDESIAAARRAIALAPNSAEAYRTLAYSLVMNGEPAEAREIADKAWRLDPRAAGQHFFLLGLIAFSEAKLEQAVELIERARKHIKYAQSFLPPLIAAYMHLGHADKGRALSETYYDYFSTHEADLRNIMYFWPFKDKTVASRLADGLLLAGVQGKRGGYYSLSEENRLTGPEIAKLFRDFGLKWKVQDVRKFGDFSMDLTDSFQEDGTVARHLLDYFGHPTFIYKKEWSGRYWIDGNLLCMDFQRVEVGGTGCRPVFRKGHIPQRDENQFVIVGALGFYEISPAK